MAAATRVAAQPSTEWRATREGIRAMNNLNRWVGILLRSPLVWGGMATALYYGGIYAGILNFPMLLRFTAGHSVEYIVTAFFFIGAAALIVKAIEIGSQRRMPEQTLL